MKHIRKSSHIALVLVLSFLACIIAVLKQRRDPILIQKTFNVQMMQLFSSVFKSSFQIEQHQYCFGYWSSRNRRERRKEVTINIKDVPIETAVWLQALLVYLIG